MIRIDDGAAARRAGSTASVTRSWASKLSAIVLRTPSKPASAKVPRPPIPALLTRTESLPPAASTPPRPWLGRRPRGGRRAGPARRAALWRSPQGAPRAGPAGSRGSRRRESRRAVASPSPLDAPVTSASGRGSGAAAASGMGRSLFLYRLAGRPRRPAHGPRHSGQDEQMTRLAGPPAQRRGGDDTRLAGCGEMTSRRAAARRPPRRPQPRRLRRPIRRRPRPQRRPRQRSVTAPRRCPGPRRGAAGGQGPRGAVGRRLPARRRRAGDRAGHREAAADPGRRRRRSRR